ncbi:MAG: hypothetical protein ACE5GT_11680 [Rhodospirillales bacterium]
MPGHRASAGAPANAGFYQSRPGELPLNFFIGAGVPVTAFLMLFSASQAFRGLVLGWDLRLLTMIQAWRVIGFAMVVLFAFGALPGIFAWPAGLGDVLVGLFAPYYALRLMERPETAGEAGFIVWNWLGILDFAVAFVAGISASGAIAAVTGAGPTTSLMSTLPMALLPGLFVPMFMIAHLAALLKVRHLRRRVPAAA